MLPLLSTLEVKPQIITINKDDHDVKVWGDWLANAINIKKTAHPINENGKHYLKYRMLSRALFCKKMVVDLI